MRTISGKWCGPFYYGAPTNRSAAPGLVINSQPTVTSMLCSDHGLTGVETDGRGGATMILPGETEAGSAGTQPCRGIAWWSYRCLENPRPRGGILTNGERLLSISG